jgi:glutamyl/glutaminyl-tRNA synthetase
MVLIIENILTATIDAERIGEVIKGVGEDLNQPANVVMQILRYALAGLNPGVGVPVILEILGAKTSLERLERCQTHNQTITP